MPIHVLSCTLLSWDVSASLLCGWPFHQFRLTPLQLCLLLLQLRAYLPQQLIEGPVTLTHTHLAADLWRGDTTSLLQTLPVHLIPGETAQANRGQFLPSPYTTHLFLSWSFSSLKLFSWIICCCSFSCSFLSCWCKLATSPSIRTLCCCSRDLAGNTEIIVGREGFLKLVVCI